MSGLLRRLRPRSRQDRPASREYSQPNDHTGQPVATSFRPAPIRFRSPGPVAVEPPAPASQLETRRGSQRACRSRCPEPTATLLPEPPAPVGPPTSSPAFPSNLRLSFTAAERIAIFGTGVEVAEIAQPGSRYRYQYSGVRLLTRSADKYLLLPVGWQRGRDAVFMVRDDDSIRVDIAAQ